jgi:methyl-accepting chemotaxis protein
MDAEEKDSAGTLKDVADKLSNIEDLQNLTQLDMLNMKNEIEKLKLTTSSPLSPEAEERLVKLEEMSKDVEMFKRWKQTVDEVKFLRDKLMGPSPAQTAVPAEADEIKEIKESIEEIRAEANARKSAAPINLAEVKAAIEENRKAVENLKQMITGKPRGAMPDTESIKKMIRENRKLINELKSKMEMSDSEVPAGMRQKIENLHAEITKLEEEVKKIKTVEKAASAVPKDDIDHLRRELFGKLNELNVKFGPRGSEEIKKAMEAGKASIEKLKSLVKGEEVDIDSLKYEMGENRKFMTEIKGLLLSKKPQAPRKIAVPPDPETRNRMLKLEQRLEFFSKKMDKMAELKPIKLPEFAPAGAKGRAVRGKPGEIDDLKKEIESIVSRMDGFLTKDEIEKGFLEKRLKADKNLTTDEIYKELNDIKKAILQNEDHVTNVATDVERMKKEIGTVEKREWSKVGEIPAIDDLKRRIDQLEKKIEDLREGPVFIE